MSFFDLFSSKKNRSSTIDGVCATAAGVVLLERFFTSSGVRDAAGAKDAAYKALQATPPGYMMVPIQQQYQQYGAQMPQQMPQMPQQMPQHHP